MSAWFRQPRFSICPSDDDLRSADAQDYAGVTHEFFGMGLVVGKAKQAEHLAVKNLKAAFAAK
ncbi:hypothetical protein P7D22_00255 [Lichenihabitans sp. Uapishka_5]|uniref:hypothetical protein n=1 Tax=Lichenihabitans sp. Uapishka_5 TaxID=3037302 RepID=UPI0029E7CEF0|nr:hypothetical protein [Lichenihabitans sp. Uapishka_5]MDX7949609.1 hypothetical protein [Lichenihabitans sp. Uapishka_5]